MKNKSNAINWFEIPASNLKRAVKLYETLFKIEMTSMEMGDIKMSLFPYNQSGGVGGCIIYTKRYKPSVSGINIYLNANPDLQAVLDRVKKIGLKILVEKTLIDKEAGYFAFFIDSEGNKIGIHSME